MPKNSVTAPISSKLMKNCVLRIGYFDVNLFNAIYHFLRKLKIRIRYRMAAYLKFENPS